MTATWKTRQGEILEVKWMDSVHLTHCLNMQIRKMPSMSPIERYRLAVDKSELYIELHSRKLDIFRMDEGKFQPPVSRETPLEMCMLRAILDTRNEQVLNLWNSDRKYTFNGIIKNHNIYKEIYFKFAQYRLQRA